jgi:hypothetical protein
MNFTPKIKVGLTAGVAALALGLAAGRPFAPGVASYDTLRTQQFFRASRTVPILEAVEMAPATDRLTAKSADYKPISSWYKNKHWWKRNAPIVGGAGGGALIGGLAGGGKGAIIGGAVGGGGGYLYKRLKGHHQRHQERPNNHHEYQHSH